MGSGVGKQDVGCRERAHGYSCWDVPDAGLQPLLRVCACVCARVCMWGMYMCVYVCVCLGCVCGCSCMCVFAHGVCGFVCCLGQEQLVRSEPHESPILCMLPPGDDATLLSAGVLFPVLSLSPGAWWPCQREVGSRAQLCIPRGCQHLPAECRGVKAPLGASSPAFPPLCFNPLLPTQDPAT